MKALKNDSSIYVEQITFAIDDCYRKNAEPTDAELMEFYNFIGASICEQGEKAFVVHLAEQLPRLFPLLKGFSPRNLRRMRDFYRTYENSPSLMREAQTLNWTQNTIILESCEANEQRAFYINLAAEKKLSKLMLIKAIEEKAFETAQDEKTEARNVPTVCAVVGDVDLNQTMDTAKAKEATCGAFVTACEPIRQGESAPIDINSMTTAAISGILKNRFALYEADAGQTTRRPIYSYQTHLPPFLAWTDSGKPPNQFQTGNPPIKNKNALPDGRTHSEIKQQFPCRMARVA